MKKIIISLFMTILCISLFSCSYDSGKITSREIELQERNIVEILNSDPKNNAVMFVDIDNIEAITELSTQILLCTVEKINNIKFTEAGYFGFIYDMKIEKILMDVSGKLKENDNIPVYSDKGILNGVEFLNACSKSPQAQKYGYTKRDYGKDDLIISTSFSSIPIEIGKSYLIYLTDSYFEKDQVYAESGRAFLYEYTDGILSETLNYEKINISFKDLEKKILKDIKNRSGRCDEIGMWAYLDELGEQQEKERNEFNIQYAD